MRILVILIVSLWSAIICQAAPQGDDPAAAPADGGGGAAPVAAVVDLKEAKELMVFLKMMVK